MVKEGKPTEKTPAEISTIGKERMKSDASAIEKGADISDEGKVEFTPEQVESARNSMDTDLREKSIEGQVAKAHQQGAERGDQLEKKVRQMGETIRDAGSSYNAVSNRLTELKVGMLFGGVDLSDGGTRNTMKGIIERVNLTNHKLSEIEESVRGRGTGTIMHLANVERFKEALDGKGKITSEMISILRESLLTNSGVFETFGAALIALSEVKI